MSRTRTRFGNRLAATSYYRGHEIQVFDVKGAYYTQIDGTVAALGPFDSIRTAAEQGKRIVEGQTSRSAANYNKARRHKKRAARRIFTVDYRCDGVWRVSLVRAGSKTEAAAKVRRFERSPIHNVRVTKGDDMLFMQGYPKSRILV